MSNPEKPTGYCVFCDNFNENIGGSTKEFLFAFPHLAELGQVIGASTNFVLIPDIAPLFEDHLLLVTKSHFASFANIHKSILPEAELMVTNSLRKMRGFHPNLELFAFEHGVGKIDGQVVQCGTCNSTDHAHLHLLPIPKTNPNGVAHILANKLTTFGLRLETTAPLPKLSLQNTVGELPYLLLWSNLSNKNYILVQDTLNCVIPSQIVRKLLAIQSLGIQEHQSEHWDWRNFMIFFPEQAEAMIVDTFQRWRPKLK